MTGYCVRCRGHTGSNSPHIVSSGGRHMEKSTCAKCGCKKCKFVSGGSARGRRGKGFLGDLVKTVAHGGVDFLANKAGLGLKRRRRRRPAGGSFR